MIYGEYLFAKNYCTCAIKWILGCATVFRVNYLCDTITCRLLVKPWILSVENLLLLKCFHNKVLCKITKNVRFIFKKKFVLSLEAFSTLWVRGPYCNFVCLLQLSRFQHWGYLLNSNKQRKLWSVSSKSVDRAFNSYVS